MSMVPPPASPAPANARPLALFPGMAAAEPGMARELAAHPSGARVLAEFGAESGVDVRSLACEAGAAELLADRSWELAVVATESAAAEVHRAEGGEIGAALGFSIGAYAALRSAGAVSVAQVVAMVDVVLEASLGLPGRYAMVAVTGPELAAVETRCRPGAVEVSAVLAPGQAIVAGEEAAVVSFCEAIAPGALRVTPLVVRWPLHTSMMGPVAARLGRAKGAIGDLRPLAYPVYSAIDGTRITDPTEGWELLVQHLTRPQRFDLALGAALADGFRRLIELGPGSTLGRLARRIGGAGVSVESASGRRERRAGGAVRP